MLLYALIGATSGEDMGFECYTYTPEPEIYGLFKTKEEAIEAMKNKVDEILGEWCEDDEEVEVDDTSVDHMVVTNRDADWCATLKVDTVVFRG